MKSKLKLVTAEIKTKKDNKRIDVIKTELLLLFVTTYLRRTISKQLKTR